MAAAPRAHRPSHAYRMFSEKTRPINAADSVGPEREISGHAAYAAQTDEQAGKAARVISIMAPIHKPHCEGNEAANKKGGRPRSRVQKFHSICESSVSESRHEIASNGENDLKVDGRNPQRKAELGGPFGVRARVLPSSSSA